MNITSGHQSQNSAMHLQEKQEANSKFHGFLVLSSNETANSMTKPLEDMDNGSTNRNSNQLSITSCSVSKAACQAEVMCGALYSHASLTPLHQFLTLCMGHPPFQKTEVFFNLFTGYMVIPIFNHSLKMTYVVSRYRK